LTRLFLLDTNIVSNLVRHPADEVARMMANIGKTRECTSVVVAARLRSGAATPDIPIQNWLKKG
jgi:tRNA(fMet)-specific endonuclease VapC